MNDLDEPIELAKCAQAWRACGIACTPTLRPARVMPRPTEQPLPAARTLLAYAQAKADEVARLVKAACTRQTCRAAAAAMTSEDADRSRRKRANIGAGVD